MFQTLDFRPLPGLSSPHLQMLFACYTPAGEEAPSKSIIVNLSDGDQLSLQVSTPEKWQPHDETLVLLHGLGGSHLSPYMVRLSRKFYAAGWRVVRINLRGCGSGAGLNKKSYSSGDSQDIVAVLKQLKKTDPQSSIRLVGFSLGGNIILKMAGELGESASALVERMIAICSPLDLEETLQMVSRRSNRLYHRYYLSQVLKQGERWVQDQRIDSIQDFDDKITVPLRGYSSRRNYYETCSSLAYIPKIRVPCDLLFASDDPFIDHTALARIKLSGTTRAYLTGKGAHMGFIGRDRNERGIFWMDQFLLDWSSAS